MTYHDGKPFLLLASASPRRLELLTRMGIACEILPQGIDERVLPEEAPAEYVRRMAQSKAKACVEASGDRQALVLGADTIVVLDGKVLGKPADRSQAEEMLANLSGRSHDVMSAVTLCDRQRCETVVATARVSFRALDRQEIAAYVDSGEPMDKAGSYGIQGLGGMLVSHMEGSYTAVVGLPVHETASLLGGFGISTECLLAGKIHER